MEGASSQGSQPLVTDVLEKEPEGQIHRTGNWIRRSHTSPCSRILGCALG